MTRKNSRNSKQSNKFNLKTQKFFNEKLNKHETHLNDNISQEEVKISYFLKCCDLKTIMLLSLMLTATYGGYKYLNQSNLNNKQLSSDSLHLNKSNVEIDNSNVLCKTAIFYEVHHDAAPVKFIDMMLPSLKENNYTTFLFEEPKGISLAQNIKRLHETKEKLNELSNIPHRMLKSFIDSFEATANLLYKIQAQELTYVAVDIDANSREKLNIMDLEDPHNIKVRDQFMANSINEACKQYKANQVFIVGSMHGGVARILKELEHKVISAFIINHPPIQTPSSESIERADNDLKLRAGNTEYMAKYGYEGMHVINFYDNPTMFEANLTGLIEEL